MGLALLNENDPDLVLLSPVTELLRNEFRPIVDSKTLRFSSPFDEFIKLALYTIACQASVNRNSEDFPVEIIDHVEGPKGPRLEETIMHKIHGPGQVGVQRVYDRVETTRGQTLVMFSSLVLLYVSD